MGAQNFTFAPNFFYKMEVFSPKFCILGRRFFGKKIFRQFLTVHLFGERGGGNCFFSLPIFGNGAIACQIIFTYLPRGSTSFIKAAQ